MADQFEMSIRLFLEPEEEALMHAPVAAKAEDWLDRSQSIEIFSTNNQLLDRIFGTKTSA